MVIFNAEPFILFLEYAAVGYMAKRIETRKKRFQALQAKIIEQKKAMLEAQAGSASEHEAAKIISRVSYLDCFIFLDQT